MQFANSKKLLAGSLWCVAMIGGIAFSGGAAEANACANGERRLPFTGLCESQAAVLMPRGDIGDAKMFGCQMRPNDASSGAGAILYWAASCKGNQAQLEMRVKGSSAEVYQVRSSHGGGALSQKVAEFYADVRNPVRFATDTAQTWMAHFSGNAYRESEISKCRARPEPALGANAYVVDDLPAPNNDYRSACGEYGMDSGETKYWLLGRDSAWFIYPLGQDAMREFDPTSITFIKEAGRGNWVADHNPASSMTASMQIADDYEVANIAGMRGVYETPYGNARGYQVYAGSANGTFKYCVGERDFNGVRLRIGFDGGQWQVALPHKSRPDYYSQYEVDGVRRGMSGTADGNWTFWWLGMPELDQLRNGSMLIMDVGRASYDFDLKGSAATITKIEECIQRRGKRRG